MNSPLVSICVPIYNVAPYIERCVRSLMEQDYSNIEYVFVNDGSTDTSIPVLESVLADYPEHKQNVHIYHNDRNHGLAYTRRVSIEKATGKYCTCVDSDDWIDHNYISSLVHQILATSADIVITPYVEHWGERVQAYSSNSESINIWGKLIKRQLFVEHHCFAPEGLDYGEDRMAMLQIYHYTKTISSVDNTHYQYVHHPNSITATKTDFHFDCLIRYWQEAERLMREWGVWEQHAAGCHKEQVKDKTRLMLQCRSLTTRKKYADLYRENELASLRGLTIDYILMGLLVHYHLWGLIQIYQINKDWRRKRKNK